METNCNVTFSQLDSTISSATSLSVLNIVLNPHPTILKDSKKLNMLKKWERKFKEGTCNESGINVKLEVKEHNLSSNITHYVIDDSMIANSLQTSGKLYSAPVYESLVMGSWILNFQWIMDSLTEGKILNEDNYLVSNF